MKNDSIPILPQANPLATDTSPVDSLALDSANIVIEGEQMQGLVLVNPAAKYEVSSSETPGQEKGSTGLSWVYLVVALLFCITALKFKGNVRYLKALLSDLTETRIRHNAFDDTVKETSLLFLLNLLWIACSGILLWTALKITVPENPSFSLSIPDDPLRGIAICTGVAACYLVGMLISYWVVGIVFSDSKLTRLWVKGSAASTALQAFPLFPLALLAISYPDYEFGVIASGAAIFIVGKIIFLYKGFRIFFTQISSWMLFLYYLCSLEIVPLVLTYFGAIAACNL